LDQYQYFFSDAEVLVVSAMAARVCLSRD